MTLMLATNSLTEVPTFASWAQEMPQIASAASANNSHWLYSALTQVREIEQEGELIPGLGDLRIAVQTAMRARILLASIEISSLPAPIVSPVSGGGLSIVWSLGLKEVKISLEPGGETAIFRIEDDEILGDETVDIMARSPIARQLRWMLDSNL